MKYTKHAQLRFEYSRITEYIYIGTNKCCEHYFRKSLLKMGIKADISLEKERLDTPIGIDYYLWLPTKDHTAPSYKQLKMGSDFIAGLVSQRIKCYVHCKRGHGRAPTLVAAYLIQKGMNVDEAIGFIKKKRPTIHINKIQKKALLDFMRK